DELADAGQSQLAAFTPEVDELSEGTITEATDKATEPSAVDADEQRRVDESWRAVAATGTKDPA
ncbi:MAG: hypothetical protein NUW01_19515, partial [Gemmatimonadaceae bacterium]|nr:hypothetical protein [Gemmatimonadaceae bacterium]